MEEINMENKNHHFSVREVEGYDPSQNLIKLRDYQGRESLYLEVKHRKDWFLRWCYANGKIGMLDDSEIVYNPISKMVEGKATVYIDGQIMARSAASKPYDPENMSNFSRTVFQDVGTIAIGRALANAGFGTVNCCLEDGDTLTTLADAPVAPPSSVSSPSAPSASSVASPATKPAPQQANPENHPLMQLLRQPQQPSATNQNANTRTVSPTPNAGGTAEKQTKEDPADSSSQTALKTASTTARTTPGFKKNPDIPLPKTVEEAKQAIMPIGSFRGKTLGEMLVQNVNQIAYYAGRYGNRKFANPAYPNLMKACQMILDAEGGSLCS